MNWARVRSGLIAVGAGSLLWATAPAVTAAGAPQVAGQRAACRISYQQITGPSSYPNFAYHGSGSCRTVGGGVAYTVSFNATGTRTCTNILCVTLRSDLAVTLTLTDPGTGQTDTVNEVFVEGPPAFRVWRDGTLVGDGEDFSPYMVWTQKDLVP